MTIPDNDDVLRQCDELTDRMETVIADIGTLAHSVNGTAMYPNLHDFIVKTRDCARVIESRLHTISNQVRRSGPLQGGPHE